MATLQPGLLFYDERPDMYNIVLNDYNKLIKDVITSTDTECGAQLSPVEAELRGLNARQAVLEQAQKDKKPEEITQAEKDDMSDVQTKITAEKEKQQAIIGEYAGKNKVVRQLIDLALLQNGMLKGEALNNFVKRSIELI